MNILKKTTVYIIILLVCETNILYATTNNTDTSQRQGNPMQMLDNFSNKVNQTDRIQDTAFNDTSNIQWQYASEFKITNTLDNIRVQIAPYIQRTMYIWLSLAVLGIIYNGFLMVTKPIWSDGEIWKVKERLIKISKGVFLLTGFYIIIQLLLATIWYVLQ